MSEKVLKITVGELDKIRMTCVKEQCGFAVELPVEKLSGFPSIKCPLCQTPFDPDHVLGGLQVLAQLAKLSHRLTVEFVLPDPGE